MNNKIIVSNYQSPVGSLVTGIFENQICICDWEYRKQRDQINDRISSHLSAELIQGEHPLQKDLADQLDEYFNKTREMFDLPLLKVGTDFQRKVWDELEKIGFGKTKTYLELSQDMNNEKAIRAVASANGANALAILIPCHRVIGKDKSLTGYAGGLKTKKQLLELEGIPFPSDQLSLF